MVWATNEWASTSEAVWFSHALTRAEAPWAFVKGSPQKVVASLELLAVFYGLALLVPWREDARLATRTVEFSASTDNQGNSGLVRKWLTTKMPLALVAMELAAQLGARHLDLDLKWRRRNLNVEADQLTNEDFRGFQPGLRIDASGVSKEFICLSELSGAWENIRHEGGPSVGSEPGVGSERHRGIKRRRTPWRERELW